MPGGNSYGQLANSGEVDCLIHGLSGVLLLLCCGSLERVYWGKGDLKEPLNYGRRKLKMAIRLLSLRPAEQLYQLYIVTCDGVMLLSCFGKTGCTTDPCIPLWAAFYFFISDKDNERTLICAEYVYVHL